MADQSFKNAPEYTISVMGPGGVGKSALTIRLVSGDFLEEYDPTIEEQYRQPEKVDDKPCIMNIMDTAGQEDFTGMREQWIREASAYVLVYDINTKNTFEDMKRFFDMIYDVKEDELANICICLAGNKCDLADESREVSIEEGEQLAKQWTVKGVYTSFRETSALAKINNIEVFHECVRGLRGDHIKEETTTDDIKNETDNSSACCVLL